MDQKYKKLMNGRILWDHCILYWKLKLTYEYVDITTQLRRSNPQIDSARVLNLEDEVVEFTEECNCAIKNKDVPEADDIYGEKY